MSNLLKLFGLICAISLFSCNKEMKEQLQPETATSNISNAKILATYLVTPTAGNYTAVPTTAINGTCGSYGANTIKAKVVSISGSQVTIQIVKSSGTFSTSGIGYVNAGSVCGGVAASQSYASGASSVTLTFNATFNQGLVHFYPTVISSNGLKYYSEPVIVYTSPVYSTATTQGALLGTVDGVNLYKNTTVTNVYNYYNGINTGMQWQCVEYVNRYYLQVFGKNIRVAGTDAYQYYGTASSRGLVAYVNGGATAPRIGDLICFSGGSGGLGHVGIITEVSSNQVKIAHQNGGGAAPIGLTLSRSGNTVSASALGASYSVQGFLRVP